MPDVVDCRPVRGGVILMCALLFTLPLMAKGESDSAAAAEISTPQSVCDELLVQAQQVDRILRSVSDRESADSAAVVLRQHLDRMQQLCGQLEKMPVENPEEARELAAAMRGLTHVFQGYIPVVERLMEVNAYGSENLVNVFHLYKVREGYRSESNQQDSPGLLSYQEWVEALEYLLYHVRKLRTPEDWETLRPDITEAAARVDRCRKAAENTGCEEVSDSFKSVLRQLDSLLRELREEQNRLSAAGLLCGSLAELLDGCCH